MIRLLAVALSLVALPAAAFDVGAMSPAERDAFRAEIRDYLLENPEVIVEAIGVLEAREAERQERSDADLIVANAEALFEDDHSFVGGNPDGDVTVVEFLDYRCSYCRRAHPIIGELLATDGNIRLIVKEFPILGEASTRASRFAIATKLVEGGEAYAALHDELMTMRGEMGTAPLTRLVEDMGFDAAAIAERAETEEVTRIIEENRALASRMRINGTPSFVVGERMLRGFLPLEGMEAVVADAREG